MSETAENRLMCDLFGCIFTGQPKVARCLNCNRPGPRHGKQVTP